MGRLGVQNCLHPPPSRQHKTFFLTPLLKGGNIWHPQPLVWLKLQAPMLKQLVDPPVPPLPLLKGTHHRSEFHGERVCFFKVGMSAILKKRVRFWPRYSHFFEKGVYFLHIQESPPQFCRIRVPFEHSKVSVLEKKGSIFP